MVRYLSVLILIFVYSSGMAQDLYMPRNIKEAYKKGTRSMDGRPGKNYWQNKADYNIEIVAMPPDRTIKGTEEIVYTNNSSDTLRNPVIKLFMNIHKPGAPRDGGASPDYLTTGVHIDGYRVDGQKQQWRDNPYRYTNYSVKLPKPLAPHETVKLGFDWHYDMSLESGREGMIDSTTFYIAYFYPRVAVYDDYNGWDRMNFVDSKEFYSDFNNYRVTITAPKNYVVWGTGTLQNPETVLQPEILSRYQSSFTSDGTVHVATLNELKQGKVTAQSSINRWTFTANNIPDMAFGMSDHFVWDAGSVVVDNKTNRRASVQAAYNDTAADYHYMVEFGKHGLEWLSNNWPGVPYPYEKSTIFQGYAGMEYPMMVNDETYADTTFSRFVAEHEIAHTYMPFYMGINETRYGFMDEGWATTFELLISTANMGWEKAEAFYRQFRVERWINDPSQEEDLPIITPGDILTGAGMGNNEYGKASLGYLAMKDMLGDELFKKCLLEYMNRWNGKHPTPWDFFYTFNDVAGKNLNWFWSSWFFSNNYIDLAITSVSKKGNGNNIVIENIGGMPAPANLTVTYADGSKEYLHVNPGMWEKNPKMTTLRTKSKGAISMVTLNGGIFMDADMGNNVWK